ncbi:beta-ketoacyl synthase N-terminal-like domain-containing protein [Kitasatospora sp. NPDC088548]|uniref:beta-ketoacyl synthase N-terminal-like domain-containing protein n=1 Tax=Kitasatospora sp. NPDC088548 TaxID=3364075 RepID=UPI00382E702D
MRELSEHITTPSNGADTPVAVIGAACRFPGGATDPASFRRLLADGTATIGPVPESRWTQRQLAGLDPDIAERLRWGCFLDSGIGGFDPGLFGISPDEAPWLDPNHRLSLGVVWEACEPTGIPVSSLGGARTGVFAGVFSRDYTLWARRPAGRTSACFGFSSHGTLVSFLLDLHGPGIAVDTACSSSLVAIHLASQSLQRDESDLALCGGVQLILAPGPGVSYARWGMLSPTGQSLPFDAEANGFVRGEGGGVVVPKRLANAHRDGGRVLAVIRGTAVNQDGRSARLTAPSQAAQEAVFRRALDRAAVEASRIDMVEAHGPGAPVGDPIGFASTAVYGQGPSPCALGSAKGDIGHTEAVSGAAGPLKTVLALHHGVIPPSVGFRQQSRDLATDGTRLSSIGPDSLMALALRNRLEQSLGMKIPRTVIRTSPSISALVENILMNIEPTV